MTLKMKLALAAAVLALISFSAWTVLDDGETGTPPPPAEVAGLETPVRDGSAGEAPLVEEAAQGPADAEASAPGERAHEAPEGFEQRAGRIAGKIVDPNGRPIEGAVVRRVVETDLTTAIGLAIYGKSAPKPQAPPEPADTDAEGRFNLETGGNGRVRIEVRAPGYVVLSRLVTADEGLLDITLQKAHHLAGTVTDEQTGEPILGVWIMARPADSPVAGSPHSTTTAGDGSFRLDGLPEGDWSLTIGLQYRRGNAPGSDYIASRVERVAADTKDITIRLRRGLNIAGSIVDGTGSPVEALIHIEVIGLTDDGRKDFGRRRLVSVRNGEPFRVPGLPEGNYDLSFTPDSSVKDASVSATVLTAVPAGSENLSVRMLAGTIITGQIKNDADEPVTAKGYIYVYPSGKSPGSPGSVMAKLEKDGRFTTPALDSTLTYTVYAHDFPGHRDAKAKEVVPGSAMIEVVLTRALRIRGQVFDQDGQPAPVGLGVVATAENFDPSKPGASGGTYIEADGWFTIEGLADATYRLSAGGGTSGLMADGALSGVKPGQEGVTLNVKPGATIKGRLIDTDGRPVRTHLISGSAVGVSGGFPAWTGVEDDEGHFTLRGLPPGKVTLSAFLGDKYVALGEFEAPSEGLEVVVPDQDE